MPHKLINLLACSLPSAIAKACCTCLMFHPSVLFFLFLSLMCFGSTLLLCLLHQQRCLLFLARQTPMNFVVLPAASCLLCPVLHCGKAAFFRANAAGCQVVMSLAAVRPCLALCICFFFLLCGSPPSRCDLPRFSEVCSGLTGAFMHLEFPPFLASGSLSLNSTESFEVC